MNDSFPEEEKLYRAVFPPSQSSMFWKKDGSLSSAAFADKNGLSVERGDNRNSDIVINEMKKFFIGRIISVTVKNCNETNAIVKYLPTKRSKYHSEIHGSQINKLLDKRQRRYLAQKAQIEYMDDN